MKNEVKNNKELDDKQLEQANGGRGDSGDGGNHGANRMYCPNCGSAMEEEVWGVSVLRFRCPKCGT